MNRERCARKARLGHAATIARTVAMVTALLVAGTARAQVCPAATPALEAIPAERRIAFIADRLDAEKGPADAWTWTWGVTNAALAAGQLAAIPFTSGRDGRVLLAVGAGLSAAAVAEIVLAPITTSDPLASGFPRDDPRVACESLARAERTLERAARNEALGSGTAAHVGNLVINGLFAIAVGATGGWRSGALSFGVGWAIGAAQILTEPRALIGDLQRYRAGTLMGEADVPRVRTVPFAVRGGGGLSFAVAF